MIRKIILSAACIFSLVIAKAQVEADTAVMRPGVYYMGDTTKPEATEFFSPVPPIVTPGKNYGDAPSDAVILFNGKDINAWELSNDTTKPADWIIDNGELTVNKKGGGSIQTKQKFMDYQLHIEWKEPTDIEGKGQARGNSGVFLASTGPGDAGYEIQVLDCYNNTTYVDGQTGAVYKQAIPLANACKKPGEWQMYDIIWTAPRFDANGALTDSAKVTVLHNGIVLQNDFHLRGVTRYIGIPYYKAHGASSIKLQSHGDPSKPLSFRNIWVRPLTFNPPM